MFRFTNHFLLLSVVVCLTACVGTGSLSQRSGTPTQHAPVPVSAAQQSDFGKALSLMKKAKYLEAIPLLETILAENDRLPGTHINLAIAYMSLPQAAEDEAEEEAEEESYKKAEQSLLRATELNPREAVGYFQLGLLYRKTGRFEQAREAYQRALRIDSSYARAHYNLAILCDIYLQELQCAIDHFEQYTVLAPADAETVKLWLTDIRRRAGVPEPQAETKTAHSGVEQ